MLPFPSSCHCLFLSQTNLNIVTTCTYPRRVSLSLLYIARKRNIYKQTTTTTSNPKTDQTIHTIAYKKSPIEGLSPYTRISSHDEHNRHTLCHRRGHNMHRMDSHRLHPRRHRPETPADDACQWRRRRVGRHRGGSGAVEPDQDAFISIPPIPPPPPPTWTRSYDAGRSIYRSFDI